MWCKHCRQVVAFENHDIHYHEHDSDHNHKHNSDHIDQNNHEHDHDNFNGECGSCKKKKGIV